jgi:hypothetical protein
MVPRRAHELQSVTGTKSHRALREELRLHRVLRLLLNTDLPAHSPAVAMYIFKASLKCLLPCCSDWGAIIKGIACVCVCVCACAFMRVRACMVWCVCVSPQQCSMTSRALMIDVSPSSQCYWLSSQQLKRLCPSNSLNHKHIAVTNHQLEWSYSDFRADTFSFPRGHTARVW